MSSTHPLPKAVAPCLSSSRSASSWPAPRWGFLRPDAKHARQLHPITRLPSCRTIFRRRCLASLALTISGLSRCQNPSIPVGWELFLVAVAVAVALDPCSGHVVQPVRLLAPPAPNLLPTFVPAPSGGLSFLPEGFCPSQLPSGGGRTEVDLCSRYHLNSVIAFVGEDSAVLLVYLLSNTCYGRASPISRIGELPYHIWARPQ